MIAARALDVLHRDVVVALAERRVGAGDEEVPGSSSLPVRSSAGGGEVDALAELRRS